jgi:hypothetical protein
MTCLPISFTILEAFLIEKWIESSSLTILLICSVWTEKMFLVYRPLKDKKILLVPFLLKGKATVNSRILQTEIMLIFQMLSKYVPEP